MTVSHPHDAIELSQQAVDLLASVGDEWLVDENDETRLDWTDHTATQSRLDVPLLVIGIGGTGRVIATHMKAAFIEKDGSVPENALFLAFDSANDPVDKQESRTGRIVRLEPESEFFLLDRVPVAGIKQNPEHHRAIVERLGNTLYKIRRTSIHNGAVQERPQGWLALAWSYNLVYRHIANRIRRLTGRSGELIEEFNRQQGVNVLITGSIPGGQGSGALLDIAYTVRHVLDNLGDQADASRVLGLLVLPGAFVGIKKGNLGANAQAFCLELEHLMHKGHFHALYPDGTEIDSYDPPFDQVSVLDGVDEQGRAYQDHTEVCAMAAQSMALLLGSNVGTNETMVSINKRYALNGEQAEVDSPSAGSASYTYLSTVGQAVLRFPARMVAKRCTLRHALAMIDDYLLMPVTRAQAQGLRPANVANLPERLQSDEHDAPHRIDLTPPATLEQIRPDEVPNQTRILYRHFLERRIHNDIFVCMKQKADTIEPVLRRSLEEEFQVLVERAQVPLIEDWLNLVQRSFEGKLAALDTELARLVEEIEQQKAVMETMGAALDQAAEGFAGIPFTDGLRRKRIRPVLASYMDEANRTIQGLVAQRADELTMEIVRRLLFWVEEHRRAVQMVSIRLHQARERLAAREVELGKLTGGRHEINLAGEEVVADLYREHAGQVDLYVREAIEISGGLLTWTQLRPDQLGTLLAQSVSTAFRPVREISVETILKRRWGDRSVQQWASRLEGLAAGAWNLDRSLLPSGGAGLADFTLFGVPNESESMFAGTDRTLVSTYDNERIVALRTIYGASFRTLKALPHWRAAYEVALGHVPLHVLPLFMQEDDRSVERLALAIVFDQIENRGNWFYFKSQDRLEENLRLGQGLEKALASFSDQPALNEAVEDRVTERIAQNGIKWAIEKIEGYVNAGDQKDDELTQKLRKAARAYAQELRRNVQATASVEG